MWQLFCVSQHAEVFLFIASTGRVASSVKVWGTFQDYYDGWRTFLTWQIELYDLHLSM